MRFQIRKATINDLKEILRLNFFLFRSDYKYDKTLNMKWTYGKEGRKYFKERITKSDGCVLVVEINKKVVGYLIGSLQERKSWRIKAKYAELENMLVLTKYRSKGIGSRLSEKFLSWCKEKQVNFVSVTASAKNQLGIQFYKRLGFEGYELILEKKLKLV